MFDQVVAAEGRKRDSGYGASSALDMDAAAAAAAAAVAVAAAVVAAAADGMEEHFQSQQHGTP
jgi:hypothetical protein